MKFEGGRYCGKLRYEAEGTPMLKAQCHCHEYQHINGGAPHMFLLMPFDELSYTRGEPKQFSRSGLANGWRSSPSTSNPSIISRKDCRHSNGCRSNSSPQLFSEQLRL